MGRHETERILEAIRDARACGQRAAIATVVRLRGSAYRREGARILIREDRTYECLLSGGCLEPAVVDAAARVIASGQSAVVTFDLADESVFGLNIGCGGAVDVRIERVGDDPLLDLWLELVRRGDAAALVTPLNGAAGRLMVQMDGTTTGALSDPALDTHAVAEALARLDRHARSGAEQVDGAELFYEITAPPPKLILFGAGDDAMPLARLAEDVGFAVTVADPRERLLTAGRFPDATLVLMPLEPVALDDRSFVVIMNHQLERDRESLSLALASPARYIGVLGTRSRYERLAGALRDEGVPLDARSLARVHSPVGLALGAETPEEIAVSIVGEILAVHRGFEGGFLNGREVGIHKAATDLTGPFRDDTDEHGDRRPTGIARPAIGSRVSASWVRGSRADKQHPQS